MPYFLVNAAQVLVENLYLLVALAGLMGLLIGSFLNVVIYRLPKMMEREWQRSCRELQGLAPETETKFNLAVPRSACPSCGHLITALENIPVLSYCVLGGKCRACKAPISMRYPLVELLTGVLLALVAYQFGATSQTLAASALVLALITLTFIDFDTQLLPDSITLPLLWLGLLFNLDTGFTDIHSAVLGAVFGYLVLWAIYWLFKIVTGKEGMGYGDFKLLAAIGAWFGWQMLPAVILLSSLVGSIIGIALIVLAKRGSQVPMPFGPYLALGGVAALFFGKELAAIYLGS
jgi:leader peptidase (prepilin peptidase) / N-methyltransferase